MNRRSLLGALAGAGAASLAGCLGDLGFRDGDDDSVPRPETYGEEVPTVENPPNAVYIPTHREGMVMPDPVMAGEYAVGPMIGQAHPFWLVTGDTVELVAVEPDDDVHLMMTVWDPETNTVLPTDEGLFMEVYKDGTLVDERPPWSMLSQSMGFHFGDNVPLDGDGTYEVRIEVPSIQAQKTGAFDGRFEVTETASFEFTFDEELRTEIFERIDWVDEEQWGSRGAIEPRHGMGSDHDHGDDHGDEHDDHDGDHGHGDLGHPPFSAVPAPESLPGQLLGRSEEAIGQTGDADFPATVVTGGGRFADDDYLVVSPRTPYNRNPIPAMGLSATVTEDGESVAETTLSIVLDDEAGLHYGASMSALETADSVTIEVTTPPQTARHQGYETAFIDMDEVTYEIER